MNELLNPDPAGTLPAQRAKPPPRLAVWRRPRPTRSTTRRLPIATFASRYNAAVHTAAVNKTFLKNMARLWRIDSRLAQQIDDLPDAASLPVQPSKAGPPTISVATPDGRTILLHSRYDPWREAGDFCARMEKTDAAVVILCGLGLGYHLRALRETFAAETVILVAEPDLPTIKAALEHTDLSDILIEGRVEFLTRLDKSHLHEKLHRYGTALMLGTAFAVPPFSRTHQADFHAACRQAILDFAAFAKMSLVTLLRNSEITCRNIAANLPTYVATPPLDLLRHRFAGSPAILVAAGPSLAKNIDQLRDLQHRAVVIAAQTTLRPLLERGIRPRFVTSLDYSDVSRQFFENLDIPDDLVLVAEPKAACRAIDAFRGSWGPNMRRVMLLDNTFAHRCLGEDLAKRTPMEPGATVMHLALYLAQWLGCDPIIFVGQDLGFTGHCYYAAGVAMHRAWMPELGRFATLEMKEWERIVRHRPILRRIEDIDGRSIYTDEQMFTYLQQFERDFARSTARIIDATEGGAKKAGAVVMPLAKAAAQSCPEPIDPRRFDYLRLPWHAPDRLRAASQILASRRDQLTEFRRLCEKTRELLVEMATLVDRPAEFNRRVARVDELRTLVQEKQVIFQMVRDVSQLGEFQKIAADRNLADHASAGQAKTHGQLKRDLQFIDSLLAGCAVMKDILDDALARFDQALEAAS